jgi:hypothetical protein
VRFLRFFPNGFQSDGYADLGKTLDGLRLNGAVEIAADVRWRREPFSASFLIARPTFRQ